MTWCEYFFNLIPNIRSKSKDKHTQVGCVIVGPDNEIRSTGYNSFVRGINDNVPERFERPEKYFWMEHSERNAIYNAARMGMALKGCTIYMDGIPCMDCARGIVQAGIIRVMVNMVEHAIWKSPRYKAEELEKSLTLLKEAGVEVEMVPNGGKN